MNTWRRRRDDEGFSLVEMSVAMVVLSVVLAALGAFLVSAVSQQQTNELRAQATQVAQRTVEEARALPWDLLGFYADDAGLATCNAGGESAVALAVPANAADRSPRVPTTGAKTVEVQGTEFTVTACYRWADDPKDGTGAADSNGTQDVKRIAVAVSWTVRGKEFTRTVEATRAPTAAEVAPRSPTGAQPFGITAVTPPPNTANGAAIDSAGKLTAPLDFTATTTAGVSTVQLRWTDATGASQSRTLTAGSSSTSWSLTLATGTGPFLAASTTFTFTAYSATGETSSQTTTVSFSQTPGSLTVTSVSATPNSVDVNTSGMSAVAFTITATTNSAATSAVVSYVNRSGSPVTQSMTVETPTKFTRTFAAGSGPFKDGTTTFTVSVTGDGGTASSSNTVTFVPPAVVPVSLVDTTASPSLCHKTNDGAPLRTTTVTVTVQGISASDTVKLQLNDGSSSVVTASYAGTSGSDLVYTYSIPTTSTLRFKNNTELTVSVLATRASDNTQATKLYTFPATKTSSVSGCPTS